VGSRSPRVACTKPGITSPYSVKLIHYSSQYALTMHRVEFILSDAISIVDICLIMSRAMLTRNRKEACMLFDSVFAESGCRLLMVMRKEI
jgi:hypothetical protein